MELMGSRRSLTIVCGLLLAGLCARAQIIEFESGGLRYQTLTKGGVTVMFAVLPNHVRDYSILQVAVANGSPIAWMIKPEDFHFRRDDGAAVEPKTADDVISDLIQKASRSDVMKLVATYEATVYGNAHMQSTNGYTARLRAADADMNNNKIKAAAAASAIALVPTKLAPGQSTDGAVFYPTAGKPLGAGHLVVNTGGEVFDFPVSAAASETH